MKSGIFFRFLAIFGHFPILGHFQPHLGEGCGVLGGAARTKTHHLGPIRLVLNTQTIPNLTDVPGVPTPKSGLGVLQIVKKGSKSRRTESRNLPRDLDV